MAEEHACLNCGNSCYCDVPDGECVGCCQGGKERPTPDVPKRRDLVGQIDEAAEALGLPELYAEYGLKKPAATRPEGR